MGWWDASVMGGDSPLDFAHDVKQLIGLPEDSQWNDDLPALRVALEAVPSVKFKKLLADTVGGVRHIAPQVLAFMHIASGARLPAELALAAIESCKNDDPDWAWSAERREHLALFAEQIRNYRGALAPLEAVGDVDVRGNNRTETRKPDAADRMKM